MKSLERLRELAESLPDGNKGEINNGIIELEVEKGIAYSIGLENNKHVAVAKTIISKGSIFGGHYHPEVEVITVYEGVLQLFVNARSKEDMKEIEPIEMGIGESYRIDKHIPHMAVALTNVRLIVISIPASKYFPSKQ